jgi:hypothetical protein
VNLFLWIVASLLAIAFLGAGAMKLTQPREKLAASGMGWTEDFSPGMVKTIGALEVLAAIGLIVPGRPRYRTRPVSASSHRLVLAHARSGSDPTCAARRRR